MCGDRFLRTAYKNVVIGDGMATNPLRSIRGFQNKFVMGYSGGILGKPHEFETILNAAQALSYAEDITFHIHRERG